MTTLPPLASTSSDSTRPTSNDERVDGAAGRNLSADGGGTLDRQGGTTRGTSHPTGKRLLVMHDRWVLRTTDTLGEVARVVPNHEKRPTGRHRTGRSPDSDRLLRRGQMQEGQEHEVERCRLRLVRREVSLEPLALDA